VANRLTGVTGSAAFVYDGDGKRVKKTENNQTTIYVNKYYEKKIGTPDEITLYYYLGNRLVALKKGTNLRYVSQDHLTGTSVTSDATTGNLVASIKYFPFGDRRNSTGTIDTDRQFTGQRLDGTGLYYYGARYYDPGIGKFISADTIVQSPANPQTMNRYAYVTNNPLRYIDPSGMVQFSPAPDPPANVISEPPWFTGPGQTVTSTSTTASQTPSGPAIVNNETSTTTWPATPAGTLAVTTTVTTVNTSGGKVTTTNQTAVTMPSLPKAPNTDVGGGGPGWTVQPDRWSGAMIVKVPESSLVAGVMRQLPTGSPDGAGGVTVNPFIIVRQEIFQPEEIPLIVDHERVHIYQQRVLGPYFLPAYGLASLVTWSYDNNVFEIMARWISGY